MKRAPEIPWNLNPRNGNVSSRYETARNRSIYLPWVCTISISLPFQIVNLIFTKLSIYVWSSFGLRKLSVLRLVRLPVTTKVKRHTIHHFAKNILHN